MKVHFAFDMHSELFSRTEFSVDPQEGFRCPTNGLSRTHPIAPARLHKQSSSTFL